MSTTAAVIGCGDVSSVHFEAIAKLDGATLVGVCDPDPQRLASAMAAYGVPGFADHQSLIEAVRPDVVHICTPHDRHASVAADCLERGVHVIVEKPLAHTLAEGRRLVEVAAAGRAKIAVCFQNRYNATSQAMHSLLSAGGLGRVLGASATVMWQRTAEYYRDRPWRGSWAGGGGGLMMNQAIHTVDLLQWLVGDVTAVSGNASTRFLGGTIEVEDTAEFVAEHANGARSAFYATLAHATNAPVTLDVVTEEAVLTLRGDLTITYADGRVEVVPERRSESGGRSYWGVSHELLIGDFYARLGDADPFWISPAEAEKSLRIVKDVYRQSYSESAARVS
ncbi:MULTISPECIES: Gfo/Idh/MocA family protein [unclassified Arthrobacter]|uniref:Gfo/Idh/MocA family protein n=1 Tax=unclassified Arthrobacter TaxID=235627 RepID=UPI001F34F4E7|nr:Gfo/Idh/MocA family oxidoreductase [Arthrobacter sp. FW305-BF8]UKA54929.1 Gfo/Idh/MocA family oxidoreductase [Arthrobacter sp. FW305-BF8]